MALTPEQLATLAADIAADPVLSSLPHTSDGAFEVAAAYNLEAEPAFYVWRTSVSAQEWRAAIVGGGGATQLDALTASKRDSLLWAVNDTLNPSVAAIRAALDDFCGSQNTLKAAIAAVEKRTANRIEKLCAIGTGSSASPATLSFEGQVSYQDIMAAWNS
jgi:hypothetical protein